MYSEQNDKGQFKKKHYDKLRSRAYVAEEQEKNKNTSHNERAENS